MSKKRILMTAAAGVVSFAGAFCFGWLTADKPESQQGGRVSAEVPEFNDIERDFYNQLSRGGANEAGASRIKAAMSERKLEKLIYEVREKIGEYKKKLKELEIKEERLKITQDRLNDDIDKLTDLRSDLASMVAKLKAEREKFESTKVEIDKMERTNLRSIAATYDKMDPSQAGEILTNMSAMQKADGTSNLEDPVKILYYMRDRSRAKVLSSLVDSRPEIAAVFCKKLKRVTEQD